MKRQRASGKGAVERFWDRRGIGVANVWAAAMALVPRWPGA